MKDRRGAQDTLTDRRANVSTRIELTTLSLCLQHGIDQVTVDDIAAAAGISRRTFYRYFETIDDVLCAMPRRSLARQAEAYKARPSSEGVVEAFVQMTRNTEFSQDERAVHVLAVEVAQRHPTSWWRAMNHMQFGAQEVYEELIKERLLARGQDASQAPLIAAVLLTIIMQAKQQDLRNGASIPNPQLIAEALSAVAAIMKDGPQL